MTDGELCLFNRYVREVEEEIDDRGLKTVPITIKYLLLIREHIEQTQKENELLRMMVSDLKEDGEAYRKGFVDGVEHQMKQRINKKRNSGSD